MDSKKRRAEREKSGEELSLDGKVGKAT